VDQRGCDPVLVLCIINACIVKKASACRIHEWIHLLRNLQRRHPVWHARYVRRDLVQPLWRLPLKATKVKVQQRGGRALYMTAVTTPAVVTS
jgi:hypothetical protein